MEAKTEADIQKQNPSSEIDEQKQNLSGKIDEQKQNPSDKIDAQQSYTAEDDATKMHSTDMELLLEAIKGFADGSFEFVDRTAFADGKVADTFNHMVDEVIKRNNHYLARINDAQSRIGDTSHVKAMLEQIEILQGSVEKLQESRSDIISGDKTIGDTNMEFLMLADQIRNAADPCLAEMKEAKEICEAIGYSLPEYEEGGEGGEGGDDALHDKIVNLGQYIRRSCDRLEGIERRIDDMSADAHALFVTIYNKEKRNVEFLENVDELTVGYKKLSAECLDTGRHLIRISRDIDNARNDMFRHSTKPTLHDSLMIYEVDHITLAWRLYNNMVEFEALRLTQVNNAQSCKFGLWSHSVTDTRILESEAFNKSVEAHQTLHEFCIKCFEAKQNYDMPLAMEMFQKVMEALDGFRKALADLHVFLRSIGITEETDVWKFRG